MGINSTYEPYIRERGRQNAEAKIRFIKGAYNFADATIMFCKRLSSLMERRASAPWQNNLCDYEKIYIEEETLLLRQTLCLI